MTDDVGDSGDSAPSSPRRRPETFAVAVDGDRLGVETLGAEFTRIATVGVGEWGALRDMVAGLDTVAGSPGARTGPPLRVVIDTQRDAREAARRLGWPHRQRLSESVARREVVVGSGTVRPTAQTGGVAVDGRERVAQRVTDPDAWVCREGRYAPRFGHGGEFGMVGSPESVVEEALDADETPAEVRETFKRARETRWWAPYGTPAALLAAWGFARAGGADAEQATEWAREAGLAESDAVGALYAALTASNLKSYHGDDPLPSVLDRFAGMVFSLGSGGTRG